MFHLSLEVIARPRLFQTTWQVHRSSVSSAFDYSSFVAHNLSVAPVDAFGKEPGNRMLPVIRDSNQVRREWEFRWRGTPRKAR